MRASYASGITIAARALFVVPQAFAHHSFAPHFDASKQANISGTVKEYEGKNPHSYLHVNAVDENGRTREYVCESHWVTQLSRIGITPQLFKAGTKIRLTGSLSRHDPYMCFFETVELADGRVLNVNGQGGSYPDAKASRAAAPQGHLRDMAARAQSESKHEWSATDDAIADAGGREGCCSRTIRLRDRPDAPMRSRRNPPRLGRTEHASRNCA